MTAAFRRPSICSLLLVVMLGGTCVAQAPMAAGGAVAVEDDGLIEFTSEEGRFSVRLPKEPTHKTTTAGELIAEQHQFLVELGQGAYLISYLDYPRIEGGPKELQLVLARGRRSFEEQTKGKVIEVKDVTLEEKYPGISIRMTVPAIKGEARCILYLVGTRLYQVIAMGVPQFMASDEATRVMESFKLVK